MEAERERETERDREKEGKIEGRKIWTEKKKNEKKPVKVGKQKQKIC